MGSRSPPPPPPPAQQPRQASFKVTAPRVHKLLYIQKADGSWGLDEQARACMRLSDSLLTRYAAALARRFESAEVDKAAIEAVFTTNVVLELARQGREYCEATPRSMRVFCTSLLVPEMLERTAVRKGAFKEWRPMAEAFLARAGEELQREALASAAAVVTERLAAVTARMMCMECRQEFTRDKRSCPYCLQRQNELAERDNSAACFDLDFSLPPKASIEEVAWEEMEGFHWFSGGLGSVGAFLCQVGGELVMAKSGGSAAVREFFGTRLFAELGIAVAQTRPFRTQSAEGQAVIKGLRGAKATSEGEWNKSYFVRKFPVIFCMEYIGGGGELCMPRPELERLQEAHPGSLWRQCGRIAAADVFINNYDRFPVAWDNLGNAANVIIRELPAAAAGGSPSLQVTAIDQTWLPIQDKAMRQAYLGKVERLTAMVAAAVADPEAAASGAARAVREGPMRQMAGFADTYLGGAICDEDFFAFLTGYHEQALAIVAAMTPEVTRKLQLEVHHRFPTGAGDLADDSFLAEVHAAMARALA